MRTLIGTFNKFHHPEHAERHVLSDFTFSYKHPSKVVEGLKMKKSVFTCPGCEVSEESLNHGDAWECTCGLKYQSYGNSLYIWRD